MENFTIEDDVLDNFTEKIYNTYLRIQLVESLMPSKTSKELDNVTDFSPDVLKELSLRKLHNDVIFTLRSLSDLSKGLKTDKSYGKFYEVVEAAKENQRKKAEFIAMYGAQKWKAKQAKKTNRVLVLNREYDIYQEETLRILQEREAEISQAEEKLQKTIKNSPEWVSKEKMTSKVQMEDLYLRLKKEEEAVKEKISSLRSKEPRELRSHSTFVSFLTFTIEEKQNVLEDWKEKSEEAFDIERQILDQLNQRLKDGQKALNDLENRIKEHEEVVNEYQQKKEEELDAKREEEKVSQAALCIQSWWRGWLVRRSLVSGGLKKLKIKKTSKSK